VQNVHNDLLKSAKEDNSILFKDITGMTEIVQNTTQYCFRHISSIHLRSSSIDKRPPKYVYSDGIMKGMNE